ncbi:hypothetical protein AGMMS50225_28090 [Betaproteobacteria bacterium]|nr:hypothetical protein AGMMS50225_28090 [Betaproteobacteria bacterium]
MGAAAHNMATAQAAREEVVVQTAAAAVEEAAAKQLHLPTPLALGALGATAAAAAREEVHPPLVLLADWAATEDRFLNP